MSDSVRPHRRQPTRLPHPWDSPRKNTGVGCHFLLQCMKVKSKSEVTQSCPTISDPTDCSLPGSSVHGIFQARVLEEVVIAFSTCVLSCIQLFVIPWTIIHQEFSKQAYLRMCCHFLLQRIFSTQRLNPCLWFLLHCRWILYCLSNQGGSKIKLKREVYSDTSLN